MLFSYTIFSNIIYFCYLLFVSLFRLFPLSNTFLYATTCLVRFLKVVTKHWIVISFHKLCARSYKKLCSTTFKHLLVLTKFAHIGFHPKILIEELHKVFNIHERRQDWMDPSSPGECCVFRPANGCKYSLIPGKINPAVVQR